MTEPSKPAPDQKVPKPQGSDNDRVRVVQQYIDDLKELLKKLRERLH